jgi:beta-lactamase regulating signal transducer with metallopeptidase domain
MIILPAGMAETADGVTIDAVLLHELTHLARGDYVWNLLLRFVCAVYWPHPGVWLLGRMIRRIREDICDAVCVYWIGDARRYCRILADVTVGLGRRPVAALGIAMTRSSRLSRRLVRIERSPRSARGLLAWTARAKIAAVVAVSVGGIGMLLVQAGPMSRPILTQLGFETVIEITVLLDQWEDAPG